MPKSWSKLSMSGLNINSGQRMSWSCTVTTEESVWKQTLAEVPCL